MKKWLIAISFFFGINASAQENIKDEPLTYRTYTSVPAFYLYSLDSTRFSTISVMQKKTPLVVIYFSPTCSHCQHQAEEITSHIKELKNIKILMVSSYPLAEIRQFSDSYAIGHFPNITLGFDPEFAMGRFYDLSSLPGIYVYGKDGKLKKAFPTNTTVTEILAEAGN